MRPKIDFDLINRSSLTLTHDGVAPFIQRVDNAYNATEDVYLEQFGTKQPQALSFPHNKSRTKIGFGQSAFFDFDYMDCSSVTFSVNWPLTFIFSYWYPEDTNLTEYGAIFSFSDSTKDDSFLRCAETVQSNQHDLVFQIREGNVWVNAGFGDDTTIYGNHSYLNSDINIGCVVLEDGVVTVWKNGILKNRVTFSNPSSIGNYDSFTVGAVKTLSNQEAAQLHNGRSLNRIMVFNDKLEPQLMHYYAKSMVSERTTGNVYGTH